MTVNEADRKVLNQLLAAGDSYSIVRPVMHFFYGERDPLYDIAERLEKPGWEEVELARGEQDFRLVATKMTDLSDDSVALMMDEINQAIEGLSVEYDGWETSVEKAN